MYTITHNGYWESFYFFAMKQTSKGTTVIKYCALTGKIRSFSNSSLRNYDLMWWLE